MIFCVVCDETTFVTLPVNRYECWTFTIRSRTDTIINFKGAVTHVRLAFPNVFGIVMNFPEQNCMPSQKRRIDSVIVRCRYPCSRAGE